MQGGIFKNTGIYLLTGAVGQALVFVLWILLARWLAPEEIGIYTLILFLIELFSAIGILGLDAAVTRFYYSDVPVAKVLNNALAILAFGNIISIASFFIAAPFISVFLPDVSGLLEDHLFLVSCTIVANTIANFVLVHYAALKNAVSYSLLQFIKIFFLFSLSIALVIAGFGVPGILYALFLSSSVVALVSFVRERKTKPFGTTRVPILKDLAAYGFPLFLLSISNVFVTYFSRILLDMYTSLATLGIFSFFLSLTIQINGLWSSFNRAWTPEFFSRLPDHREKAMDELISLGYLMSFLYLAAVGILIVAGNIFLFASIFKSVYISNINLFYILLLGPLFTGIYTIAYPLYYFEKKTSRILLVSLALSAVNFGLTFFMIRFYHQTGAALSYVVISIITAFAYLLSFRKSMSIPAEIFRWTLVLSVLAIAGIIIILTTESAFLFFVVILGGILLSFTKSRLLQRSDDLVIFIRGLIGRFRQT